MNTLPSLHCSSPDINESSDGQREAESASPDSGYDQQTTSPNSSKSPILIKAVMVKYGTKRMCEDLQMLDIMLLKRKMLLLFIVIHAQGL